MEAITELPEIKSELNTEDFRTVVTTSSGPASQHQEHQQNNCQQWVSLLLHTPLQYFLSPEIPFFKTPTKGFVVLSKYWGPQVHTPHTPQAGTTSHL